VVHHQRGYRPQRDAGEGQIARLPGEVGDSDDQRDGRCHLVDRLGEIDMVGQPDPHTERPTRPYNTDETLQVDPARNDSCPRSATSRRTFGRVGTCCRRPTTDR
jgi:hypothetical protein